MVVMIHLQTIKAGTITLIVLHIIKQEAWEGQIMLKVEASATLTTVEEGILFLHKLVVKMHQ